MFLSDRMNNIPKKIHLFWFGRGEKNDTILKCIESWKIYAPEYQIIEWNEDNFDVNFCVRSKQAYEQKKWAFVADIARLKVIYEQGGIYLDTDVLMKEPIDNFLEEISDSSAFFMYHNERYIGTGYGFGAVSGHPLVKHLLDNYMKMDFELKNGLSRRVCTHIETDAIEEYSKLFQRDNKTRIIEDKTMVISTGIWTKYFYHFGTGTWVEGGRTYDFVASPQKYKKIKSVLRNPKNYRFIRKYLGRKAETLYEFITYDLLDMGIVYFSKRLYRKIANKIKK